VLHVLIRFPRTFVGLLKGSSIVLSDNKHPSFGGWLYVLVGAWVVVVGTGMLLLANYVNEAGPSQPAPVTLPEQAGHPEHATYRLVIFVHPRCPCSSASVRELARLMASCQGRLEATVYCYRPAAESDHWIEGSLYESVAAIPGVNVRSDPAGEIARQFGAETSGLVLVYDPQGKLCFQGGITAARGHEGDNLGAAAIRACVLENLPDPTNQMTPVFGCELRTVNEDGR
jgi:hypothetical protein